MKLPQSFFGNRFMRTPIVGEKRPGRVALGYPFGSGLTGPFHESLMRIQRYELSKPKPLLGHLLPQSGLYIDHNRNRIVEKFWNQTDAEWLLQLDSDVEFPPNLVELLLAIAGDDKKVLAASVPLGPPFPSCGWVLTEMPGIWECVAAEKITREGVAVNGLATAVMLVHRDVFTAIAEREGQIWFLKLPPVARLDVEKSRLAWEGQGPVSDRQYIPQGEDLSFCLRAQDAGFTPWVAKVPGLKHHKTLPLSHDYEDELPEVLQEATR